MRPFQLICVALLAGGCGSAPSEPLFCTNEARPGLSVSVLDAVSGQPIDDTSLVIGREGEYADTAEGPYAGTYFLAWERSGSYVVTVEAPGYRPWMLADVKVTENGCHVNTLPLAARLIRLPP